MYLFFSDIDGTLLDHDTYSYESSRAGINALRERRIPLVLVSSKTCVEIQKLHDELLLDAPFIFENGGGIMWQGDTIDWIGMKVSELHGMKDELEAAIGMTLRFITDMEISEIVALTGLTHERAALARQRSTSLPFILPDGMRIEADEMARINSVLGNRGVAMTKGGRFYHFLSRDSDKGKAILRVVDDYRIKLTESIITIGIGDSENDIPMLMAVDLPFMVKKKNGTAIKTELPAIRETEGIGPSGFTEAVTAVLSAC